MKKKIEWKRKCPKCGEIIKYKEMGNWQRARERNSLCKSCVTKGKNNPMYGKKRPDVVERNKSKWMRKKVSESLKGKKRKPFTDEHKKNIKDNHADFFGKNHPMYGKCAYDIWVEKYGKEEADKRKIETNKKKRLSAIKRRENKYGQCYPNHNPEGCKRIDEYNKKHGFNFQHAENGGEVCIGGYFPDGVDEKRKTIIEVDEPRHFNSDGTLKEKDIERQNYLEGLGYKFIRVKI